MFADETDDVAMKGVEERRGVRWRDSAMKAETGVTEPRERKQLCGDGVVIDGRPRIEDLSSDRRFNTTEEIFQV